MLYLIGNAALFYLAVKHYSDTGADSAIQIARGAGACLNLNGALIIVPVCRGLWSKLRHTFIARLIPIDDLVQAHKFIGFNILFFSAIHIGAHGYNYWLAGTDILSVLATTVVGITGIVLVLALYLMVRGYVSRASKRQLFVWTHLLYCVFIIALILHGPVFWQWLLVPAALLVIDAVIRLIGKSRQLQIVSLTPLSDGVTRVMLEKQKAMNFYPGDYIRIKIPAIARTEWHPFTISAAPESNQFAIHVRNNGDWSGALHNFSRKKRTPIKKSICYVDGPYSSPTSSIYRSNISVLIAAGIGVTPFASVLQSILLRDTKATKHNAGRQIIYFHWLNRSQKSYEWFTELLARAEQQLGESRFQLSIHLTSLSHNLTNIVMQIAIEAYRKRYDKDPLTQLKAKTSAGRPNWDKIFSDISHQHGNAKVDVYYCGPPTLASTLKVACRDQGFFFHQERFD